ncbi:MAG: CHAT domain-containing tetratricopeptide repeat protein [Almyronema sp.]
MKLIVACLSPLLLQLLPLTAIAQTPESLQPYYQSLLDDYLANPVPATAQDWQAIDRLNGAGIAYRYFGNPQAAWALHQRALAIAQTLGDRPRELDTLRHLATTANQLGDDQGIDFYQQQLAIAQQRQDAELEAYLLNNLNLAYTSIGDLSAALATYQRYLPLVSRLGQWENQVHALQGLSTLYFSTFGQPQTALELLKEAQAIAQTHVQTQPQILQNVLLNLATVYELLADTPNLIQTYQQGIALTQQTNDYQSQLLMQQKLAYLYARLDQFDLALPLLTANLTLAQQQQDTTWAAWSLDDLSFAYWQQGDLEQAIAWQTQALARHQAIGDRSGFSISEAQAHSNLGWLYLAQGQAAVAERSLRVAIAQYEGLADSLWQNQGLFGQRVDDLQVNLREGFRDTYQVLQQALVAQNQITAALEVAEQGRARSLATLLALQSDLQATPVEPPNLAQLQQIARSHQTTLVEYSVLYDQPRSQVQGRLSQVPREAALLIWVVQPSGQVDLRQVNLRSLWSSASPQPFGSSPLNDLVQQTREALGIYGRGLAVTNRTDANRPSAAVSLQQLYQVLIAPIADLLPSDPQQRLTIIPQDSLFFVPFAALQDPEGRYLIEQHTLLMSPSIQILGLTEQRRQQLDATAGTALVVGNPLMPQIRPQPTAPLEPLPRLPGAEQEARAIADLLNTSALIGAEATKAALLERLPTARVIHLATHGLLDATYGFQSALALTPTATDNGLLNTREIINLDLKAELVVLSACDTGRGRLTGDGVIGLSRSFIGAGVPSVVVSLWVVPDAPTATLMTAFYRHWQQSQDKAQALRQAMLETKTQYPAPQSWAAFTLIGEAN